MTSTLFKTCTKCKISKPFSEYTLRKNRNFKPAPRCKSCHNSDRSEWRAKPESKELLKKIDRRARLKWAYGLTEDDLQNMLCEQQHSCAICDRQVKLVVDHCHETGQVRGLLCYSCNTLLGSIENNNKMKRVERYIGKTKTSPEVGTLPGYKF